MCSELFRFVGQGLPVDLPWQDSFATGLWRLAGSETAKEVGAVGLRGSSTANSALRTKANLAAPLWPKVAGRCAPAFGKTRLRTGWKNQACGRLPYRQTGTGNSLKRRQRFACRDSREVSLLRSGLTGPATRNWRPIQQNKDPGLAASEVQKQTGAAPRMGAFTESTKRNFQGAVGWQIRSWPKTGLGERPVIGLQTATADASNFG